MLKSIPIGSPRSDIASILTAIGGGRSPDPKEIAPGVYLLTHWNATEYFGEYIVNAEYGHINQSFGDNWISEYGVCDTYQQVLDRYPILLDESRAFIITLVSIKKSEQSPSGGWRWHKWGEYIGTKNPQYEYLFDEGPDIEEVFTYHIYELCMEKLQGASLV